MRCRASGRTLSSTSCAHTVRDPNGRAYNRTAFLPERRKMMQEWADYLDRLRAGEANGARDPRPGTHGPGLPNIPGIGNTRSTFPVAEAGPPTVGAAPGPRR